MDKNGTQKIPEDTIGNLNIKTLTDITPYDDYVSNQKIAGNVIADNILTLTMNIKDGSSYKRTINNEDIAKTINITLDISSTLSLTEILILLL